MFESMKFFQNESEKLAASYDSTASSDSMNRNFKIITQIIIQIASSVFRDLKFRYSSLFTSKKFFVGTTHWAFANADLDPIQSLGACFPSLSSTAHCSSSISNTILVLAIISTVTSFTSLFALLKESFRMFSEQSSRFLHGTP